ncbi:DUF58 domain-containing protein [Microbacterium sp. NPDC055683]
MTTEDATSTPDEPVERTGWTAAGRRAAVLALAAARAVAGVVRPLAWILLAAAVVLGVLGTVYGWREVRTIAVVLAATLVLSVLFLFGRTSYAVELDLTRTRVVVGERAVGALRLANTGTRRILPSRIVLPVGSGRGVFGVRQLAPGDSIEELFSIPTQKRAVLAVGPVSIVRGDPFGLYERVDRRDEPVPLYVHPRTVRLEGQSIGFVRDLEGMETRDLARDDIAFHALSEYQPGDDLRHVHWRSTARTGTLMMRTYEQTRRSHFVIGLSTATADYAGEAEFETAVSAAASLGLRALRDAFHVEARVPAGPLRADSGRRLLDSLSGVDGTRSREGRVADLAGAVAASAPLASVVVLVCGGGTAPADLRDAVSRLPAGARTLAVVVSADAETGRRRIGDTDVLTIAELDDLPRALRKALG